MANDILSALTGPVKNEDQMQALADALRKRKRAADFFSMTTIKPLAAAGRAASDEVTASAKQQGLLRESLAQRLSDEQVAQAKADAQATRDNRAQANSDRTYGLAQARNAIAAQKANTPKEAAPLKPPAKEIETFIGSKHMLNQMDVMDNMFSEMTEEQQKQLNQPYKEIGLKALDLVTPEGTSRVVREEKVYTDPKVRSYLAAGNRMTQTLSNLAAGLALTKYEIQNRDTWSPFAPGISQKERQVRMDNLRQDFGDKMQIQSSVFPQLEELSNQFQAQQGGQAETTDEEAQEGDVIENPETGERLVMRNGEWVPE